MSNNIALKQTGKKDENQSSGSGRKTSASALRPPEQTLKCPRCDSTNTKFCYYNNYNLTQPRHFCKTCRRYWTKGGALRNIPIGGGCRKNKKTKSCGSKFVIGGESLSPPVMDFQLGGINYPPSNLPFMNLDPLGFNNFPKGDNNHNNQSGSGGGLEMGFTYTNLHHGSNLTSSIESLSSLNQDLHWKLQQQRLTMLFGGGGGVGGSENHHQRNHQNESGLQPILFQNLEIPRKDGGGGGSDGGSHGGVGGLATESFFHNNYAPVNVNIPTAAGNDDQQGSININNWNVGIEGWNHMNHYNAIP